MTAEDKLAQARSLIKQKAPYLAPTIYGFIPHEVAGMNTMGVTKGMVLMYDPVWVQSCTTEDIAGALVHESMHVLREHLVRGERMENKDIANIAMDLAINPDITNAGWTLPHGVFPKDFNLPPCLTAEEYYELLSQQQQDKQAQQGQQGQQPQEQPQSQPASGQEQSKEQQTQNEKAVHGSKCTAGACGGIAANPGPKEKEIDESFGRTEADKRSIVKQTMQAIKEEAQRGRGNIPGELLEQIKIEASKNKVRWQDELKHTLRACSGRIEAGGMDFSLAHPSKRSPSRGFPRPGLVQYLPEVCFIVDTSGSMGVKQISEAFGQAAEIVKTLGVDTVWLLQADTKVSEKRRVRTRELTRITEIKGRGGTDFDEALKSVETLKPRPDLVIYLTDGDGTVTYRPKSLEVIWCIVPSYYKARVNVDWGHQVIIEEK